MTVLATIGDRTVTLDIHTQGAVPQVIIAGTPSNIELVQVSSHSWSLLMDDRSYHLSVHSNQQGCQVLLDDKLLHVTLQSELDRTIEQLGMGGGNNRKTGEVKATIPGLIATVEVEVGQQVATGDPLLVLEAMKMENELLAPIAGVVNQIAVATGDTVEKGTLLVRIDPA